MKIENRSSKQSHELDGIGVGRNRTVPFSSDSTCDSDAYDPVKTRLSESQAEAEVQEPTNHNARFYSLASNWLRNWKKMEPFRLHLVGWKPLRL